ncbi:MAG: hypothetical protein VXW66_05070, partial [Pseudomonadota bacterium]|nr:hypothetical protein [Pseudomonadota bacterium]
MPKYNQIVIAILAVLIVIAGAIFYFNMPENPDSGLADAEADSGGAVASVAAPSDGDPLATPNPLGELSLGDPAAPITLVEYSS